MDEHASEPWIEAEKDYLREHWPTRRKPAEIAARLGRTPNATRQMARKLGLFRPSRCWTEVEVEQLRKHGHLSNVELARMISRPSAEISRARKRFGVQRLRAPSQ